MSSQRSQSEVPIGAAARSDEDRPLDVDVWGPLSGSEFLWQTWDDETIVFNTASGQTHLLDALSAETLKEIERSPGTIPQLSCRLAESFQISIEDVAQRLSEILTRFEKLGLIEPLRR